MLSWIIRPESTPDLPLFSHPWIELLLDGLLVAAILLLAAHLINRQRRRKAQAVSKTGPISSVPANLRCALVDAAGQIWRVDAEPFEIGRTLNNALVLSDTGISAHHARIAFHASLQAFVIQDLNSLNGVTIDGKPTCFNVLADGSQLSLGQVTFTIQVTGQQVSQP